MPFSHVGEFLTVRKKKWVMKNLRITVLRCWLIEVLCFTFVRTLYILHSKTGRHAVIIT